ncbi:uncharacterized protein LOC134912640 [Pseudophryne corroboree]|uniref:uncharacterized protein LOC134912640 n=1 Tax=Pseudophryne corroboree TaxID=495146 RepID=UPI003081F0AF
MPRPSRAVRPPVRFIDSGVRDAAGLVSGSGQQRSLQTRSQAGNNVRNPATRGRARQPERILAGEGASRRGRVSRALVTRAAVVSDNSRNFSKEPVSVNNMSRSVGAMAESQSGVLRRILTSRGVTSGVHVPEVRRGRPVGPRGSVAARGGRRSSILTRGEHIGRCTRLQESVQGEGAPNSGITMGSVSNINNSADTIVAGQGASTLGISNAGRQLVRPATCNIRSKRGTGELRGMRGTVPGRADADAVCFGGNGAGFNSSEVASICTSVISALVPVLNANNAERNFLWGQNSADLQRDGVDESGAAVLQARSGGGNRGNRNVNEFLVDVSPCFSTEESLAAPEVQDDSGESAAVVESALDEGGRYGYTPGLEGLAFRALAPSTLRGYKNAMGEWERYVRLHQDQGKTDYAMLLDYVWECFRAGRPRGFVTRLLSALSYFLRLYGRHDFTKSFFLAKIIKGWARVMPPVQDARRPITISILRRMAVVLQDVCASDYETLLFTLCFAMAFFGAFRVSELVAASKSARSPMLREHVSLEEGGLWCKVQRSKTDQLGKGCWVVLNCVDDIEICPVSLARIYLKTRSDVPGPGLQHLDGMPVTQFQFRWVMERCICTMGLPVSRYGTHSFRIGAATTAAAEGCSSGQIRALGRWKSDVFRKYIRF